MHVSVVADPRLRLVWVACPPAAVALVSSLEGAEHDDVVKRWTVPLRSAEQLRRVLESWPHGYTWSTDHRAPRVCDVCRQALAPALVAAGESRHIGCLPPSAAAQPAPVDAQGELW